MDTNPWRPVRTEDEVERDTSLNERNTAIKKELPKKPWNVFMDGLLEDYYGLHPGDANDKEAVVAAYRRFGRDGRDIMAFAHNDPQKARAGVDAIGQRMEKLGMNWNLNTAANWFLDWAVNPEAFENETTQDK